MSTRRSIRCVSTRCCPATSRSSTPTPRPTASTPAATPSRGRTATASCNRRARSVGAARARALVPPPHRPRRARRVCAGAAGHARLHGLHPDRDAPHALRSPRRLLRDWRIDGDVLEFWITADTFMRHMNRVLVGTMLDVAAGNRTRRRFRRAARGAAALGGRRDRATARAGARVRGLSRALTILGSRACGCCSPTTTGSRPTGCRRCGARCCASPGIELVVIAPDGNRSAMARSITTRRPLWVERGRLRRRHARLRDRRHAGRLRPPGEPRARRGLPAPS